MLNSVTMRPICRLFFDDNPDFYYHKKACKANQLRQAIKEETDPVKLKELKKLLDRTLFVGD